MFDELKNLKNQKNSQSFQIGINLHLGGIFPFHSKKLLTYTLEIQNPKIRSCRDRKFTDFETKDQKNSGVSKSYDLTVPQGLNIPRS